MEDTIAAISTALGVGAISIIRVSGKEAISIVSALFKGKDLHQAKSHTINYGHIIDKNSNEIIDEVLISIMKAPKSFTMEDVVEINCHGSIASVNRILTLILNNGARLAEPGEFTKRAFLNGRIDLSEAEAVMDLINAKTETARKIAIQQMNGGISNLINDLRAKILDILANIEVNIDYPEYEDIEVVTNQKITSVTKNISDEILEIIKNSNNAKIIKEGIRTLIIGRPNVGKSSILNLLIEEDKAIVTNIPGTTRDIVEGTVNLDGILLNIVDTAGIRETQDLIEQIGIKKSVALINESDLVLVVLNNNEELTEDDKKLLELTKNKKRIIVINKTDLPRKINLNEITGQIVNTNAIDKKGLEELKKKISEMFNFDEIMTLEQTYLTNSRQLSILNEIEILISNINQGLKNDLPTDIIGIDLKKIWELLGDIIGIDYSNELVNQLFKNFCLGK